MAMRTSDSHNRRGLTVMKQRDPFLAKLFAVCVLLLGMTVMNFAWAAKTAPASHHNNRAASTRQGKAPAPVTSHSAPAPVTPRSASAPVTPRSEHGGVGSAAKSEWGPIDTRITVVNGPHSRPSANAHDLKKPNIARPMGTPRDNHQVRKSLGEERVVKNAIGLPIRQPNATRNAPVARNAIGLPIHQPNASRNAPVARTAIGLPIRQPNASPNALGAAKKPINTQLTASINRSMINGTSMGRPGWGTMAIGGPKRKVAGVIDGTSFRPRHP
jgi:hypothetical protein